VDCVDLDSEGEETEEGEINREEEEIFLLVAVETKTLKAGYISLVAEIQV